MQDLKERNAKIVDMRLSGQYSLKAIADEFGITPQRVDQILAAGGVNKDELRDVYSVNRMENKLVAARAAKDSVMLRWMSGQSISKIAREMGLFRDAVITVVEENKNIEMETARRGYLTEARGPVQDGPRDTGQAPRSDRKWTTETIFYALYQLALDNGGTLPSSSVYQKISKQRNDLPSFGTIRNRVARWLIVSKWVNDAIIKNQGAQ